MDVNEQERLSNFTLKTQNKVMEQGCYSLIYAVLINSVTKGYKNSLFHI